MSERPTTTAASTRRLARTRGAASGVLLVILGAWGALIPFIGPWFDFAYTPDKSWKWTAARGWLEVLPGAVVAVGGLLLLFAASRVTTLVGAWFAVLGGAWFVVGPVLAKPFHLGSVGHPTASGSGVQALESLAFFYALGALIVFLGGLAFGRLSVVTVRDLRVAERREAARIEAEQAAAREAAERQEAERQIGRNEAEREAARQQAERDAAAREGVIGARTDGPMQEPAPATAQYPVQGAPGGATPYPPAPPAPETLGRHDPAVVEEQGPVGHQTGPHTGR